MIGGERGVMAQNVVASLANYFQVPDDRVLGDGRLYEFFLRHTGCVAPDARARFNDML